MKNNGANQDITGYPTDFRGLFAAMTHDHRQLPASIAYCWRPFQ
jgi:hypothetical protein